MGSSNSLPAKMNKEKKKEKNHREREKQQGMHPVFQQNDCINHVSALMEVIKKKIANPRQHSQIQEKQL